MPRVINSTDARKVQVLIPAGSPIPSIFKGFYSFKVNRGYVGSEAAIFKPEIEALTKAFEARAVKNEKLRPSLEAWRKFVGEERDVPGKGGQVLKQFVVTKEVLKLPYFAFKKFGWWIKFVVPVQSIQESMLDSGNLGMRGFKSLLPVYMDAKPIGEPVYPMKKGAWLEKAAGSLLKKTGKKELNASEWKRLEREYSARPKGKSCRFYVFPILKGGEMKALEGAALNHAVNEVAIMGLETVAEVSAELTGLRAGYDAMVEKADALTRKVGELQAKNARLAMQGHDYEDAIQDTKTPIDRKAGTTDYPDMKEAKDAAAADALKRPRKPFPVPLSAIIVGVSLLFAAVLGDQAYVHPQPYGLAYMAGALVIPVAALAGVWLKGRSAKPKQLAPPPGPAPVPTPAPVSQ